MVHFSPQLITTLNMNKQLTACIKCNQHGNLRGKATGKGTTVPFSCEFDARVWLAAQVLAGHVVSADSYYSGAEVASYAQYV